jgi:hypothetical protein
MYHVVSVNAMMEQSNTPAMAVFCQKDQISGVSSHKLSSLALNDVGLETKLIYLITKA